MIKTAILTISDKGSRGEREDKSGQTIRDMLNSINAEVCAYEIIPDEQDLITQRLRVLVEKADLILTTGGTGVGPRDVTPEATRVVIEKELPGFGEAMRMAGFKITPRAIGSRAIAGICKQTLIINLPGSPKSVSECLGTIIQTIPHTIDLIKGKVNECGRT
ncbi:MAG TPA: molybdopterin adenylyltransferase [Candidatus Brocadiales bacterium]|nr:molybdopterin adenylyltransferase [Candidatus Brocadiales bacterium]